MARHWFNQRWNFDAGIFKDGFNRLRKPVSDTVRARDLQREGTNKEVGERGFSKKLS